MANTHTVVHHDRIDQADMEDRKVEAADHTTNVAARAVNIIAAIIIGFLGLRFVLMLLGANQGNALVDFVYSVSYPFAAPFFGIFNYQVQYGAVRFEFETLVAMAFYALVAWLIVRIITIGNRKVDV